MATFIYEKISLSLLVPLLIIYCFLLLYQNGPLGVEMPAQNSLAWFVTPAISSTFPSLVFLPSATTTHLSIYDQS
jgi:hypothetical protein